MAMGYHKKEIIRLGKELAQVDDKNRALLNAREWWKAGALSRYSNEDFVIMQTLQSAIDSINRSLAIHLSIEKQCGL